MNFAAESAPLKALYCEVLKECLPAVWIFLQRYMIQSVKIIRPWQKMNNNPLFSFDFP